MRPKFTYVQGEGSGAPVQDALKPSLGARSPLPAGYGPGPGHPTPPGEIHAAARIAASYIRAFRILVISVRKAAGLIGLRSKP
jgi:hypothetical protein